MHKQVGYVLLLHLSLLAFTANAQNAEKSLSCFEKKDNYKLQWTLVDSSKSLNLPAKSGSLRLPKKYKVFVVTSVNLKNNLTALRTGGGTITLPFIDMDKDSRNVTCLVFNVENSGTMPKALNDKYPDIVSLKGTGSANKSDAIRFDYDGSVMNISITVNGVNYLYAPYKVKNKVYYLLFKKTDNNNSSRLIK